MSINIIRAAYFRGLLTLHDFKKLKLHHSLLLKYILLISLIVLDLIVRWFIRKGYDNYNGMRFKFFYCKK